MESQLLARHKNCSARMSQPKGMLQGCLQQRGHVQLVILQVCSMSVSELGARAFADHSGIALYMLDRQLGVSEQLPLRAGFVGLFRGRFLKPLLIGSSLMLFQQITGQPSVLYYAAGASVINLSTLPCPSVICPHRSPHACRACTALLAFCSSQGLLLFGLCVSALC